MSTNKSVSELDSSVDPPSYDSLTASPGTSTSDALPLPPRSQGLALLSSINLTRSQRIFYTLHVHILPLLQARAEDGLSKTTIAMIPSDIGLPGPSRATDEKSEFGFGDVKPGNFSETGGLEVLGFADSESLEVSIVRLQGPGNRSEFWRSPQVLDSLKSTLETELNEKNGAAVPAAVAAAVKQEKEKEKSKRSFFLGKREKEGEGKGKKEKERLGVGVGVDLEEVCLRTQNEFGLFETLTKMCVVVRVDARC